MKCFVVASILMFVLISTSQSFASGMVIIEQDPDNPLFLKDPILAGMLSVVVGGAGQLYNEEYTKATAFFCVSILGFAIAFNLFEDLGDRDTGDFFWLPANDFSNRELGSLLILASSLVSMTEAHNSAKRINKERLEARRLQVNSISSSNQLGLRIAYRF